MLVIAQRVVVIFKISDRYPSEPLANQSGLFCELVELKYQPSPGVHCDITTPCMWAIPDHRLYRLWYKCMF